MIEVSLILNAPRQDFGSWRGFEVQMSERQKSLLIEEENKQFTSYVGEMAAACLLPQIEKGKRLRQILLKHASPEKVKKYISIFRGCGLDY